MTHTGYRYVCGIDEHVHEYSLSVATVLVPTSERTVYQVRIVPDAAPDDWAGHRVIVSDGPAPWIQRAQDADTVAPDTWHLYGDCYDRYAAALEHAQRWAINLIDMLDRR